MLIHQHAFQRGHGHVGTVLGRIERAARRLQEGDFHFRPLRLAQQSDGIGAAAGAVRHDRQQLGHVGANGRHAIGRRRFQFAEGRALHGIQGHAVGNVGPQIGDLPRHVDHVIVVHPGNDDRVDLDHHVVLLEHADGLGLAAPNQLGPGNPAIDLLAVADPGIDLGADLRIDGVDGQRDVAHRQLGKGLGMRRQAQPVGGHAQQHFRIGLADQSERLQRQRRRGEGIARAGDADDRDPRVLGQHPLQVIQRLPRREHGRGHAGPALVGAVVDPLAEIALHVAIRRDRQVYAAVAVAGVDVETGVRGNVRQHGCSFVHMYV